MVEPGNPHQEVGHRRNGWCSNSSPSIRPSRGGIGWRRHQDSGYLPTWHRDTPDGTAVSYVEWTRTRSVEQIGRSTFRATVLLRRLVAPDGNDLRRLPTEQVTVTLQIEADGRIRAASLPEVTSPPIVELVPHGRRAPALGLRPGRDRMALFPRRRLGDYPLRSSPVGMGPALRRRGNGVRGQSARAERLRTSRPSGALETVTKSAVMNTAATPSIRSNSWATGSSAALAAT